MKTNKSIETKNKRQTSATVPHHLSPEGTGTETAQATAPAPEAKPETKPDNRLPIDYAQRAENRKLDTAAVTSLLRELLPAVHAIAQVVGSWVWVQFPERPDAETRQQLSQLGFHWNTTRQAWQHPCGKFSLGSSSDPRQTYTTSALND